MRTSATLSIVFLLSLCTGDAVAQVELTPQEEEKLAGQYAPRLRFAPGELYFPTIPFFTAFEPRKEGDAPVLRLSRLDEVVSQSDGTGLVSWNHLLDAYHEATPNWPIGPVPAVFYRVRGLTDHHRDQMWDFLKNDEQAWERSGLADQWPASLQDQVEFISIEYYFYYINDNGLEGHPEDIEFAFVFIPVDEAYRNTFRIVVGAGHNPRTPNNVLVQSCNGTKDCVQQVDILVEKGGHASAPDVFPYGEFQVGIDVNWHASEAWGTRDLLAVTGTGFVGGYRPDMTLRRPRGSALVACPPHMAHLRGGECDGLYSLLPVQPFAQLDSLLLAGQAGEVGTDNSPLAVLDGVVTVTDEAIDVGVVSERLAAWSRDLCCKKANGTENQDANRHKIWKHEHYSPKDAVDVFKFHLYRPSTVAFEKGDFFSWWDLLVWGGTWHPAGDVELHAGLVVPAPTWLPTRLPGVLEVHAGIVHDVETRLSVSALYDNEYRDYFGWFARIGWIPDREGATGLEDVADFTLSAGLSVLIWSWDDPWGKSQLFPVNILRLRIGPRLDLDGWDTVFQNSDWEIQLSFNR